MTYHETGSKDIVELNLNTNPTKSVSCCAWFLPPKIIFVSSGPQSCEIIIIMMIITTLLWNTNLLCKQWDPADAFIFANVSLLPVLSVWKTTLWNHEGEPWGGTSSRQITKKTQKNRKTKTPLSCWDRQRDQETCDQPDDRNISDQFGSRKPMTRFSRLSRPRFNHAPWLCSTELLSQG